MLGSPYNFHLYENRKKMVKKSLIDKYFGKIIYYTFWVYFLFIILYFVIGGSIPVILGYLFWLLLGLYVGNKIGNKTSNNL